jgi:hypothetical protein
MNVCQNCIWWNMDRHKDQMEKGSGTCFYDPPRTFEVPVRSAITGAMGIESTTVDIGKTERLKNEKNLRNHAWHHRVDDIIMHRQ